MIDISSNVAVGAWTNCVGYQMLLNLMDRRKDPEEEKRRLKTYHIIVWGLACTSACFATLWGCLDVGCHRCAWDFKGVRILVVLVPSLISISGGILIGSRISWRCTWHDSNYTPNLLALILERL